MRIWGFAFVLLTGCACEQAVIAQPQTVATNPVEGAIPIDFRMPATGDSVALEELNRRALELGADTVVGAQIVREGDEVHVTGVAVRSNGEPVVLADVPSAPNATVPMYDDSTGPKPSATPQAGNCPQCYVSSRFNSENPSMWSHYSYGQPWGVHRRFR